MRACRARGSAFALGVAALVAGLPSPATSDPDDGTASFDYLYIEANEGGSSGGHTAIRFGPQIYHFQHRGGLLVLERERADEFLFSYALLSNRTVHVSQVGVDEEVEARLEDRFLRRYRAQEAQLAVRDALYQDRMLLERAEAPSISVSGYGYFQRESDALAEGTAALRALREKIAERYGTDFGELRRQSLWASLETLEQEDPAAWPVVPPLSDYDHPPFAYPWSSRFVDLTAGLAALDILEQARVLDPGAVNAPQDAEFQVGAEERGALERFTRKLEEDLVVLAGSLRDDWGQAFLVGMARLAALEASLASGHFVFLDVFPEQHGTIDEATLERRSDIVPRMLEDTREQLAAARRYFTRADDPGELAWERVEERLVRHYELARAAQGESDLRLARGHLVPERAAPYPLPRFESRVGVAPGVDLARVRARERDYAAKIRRLHRYRLISQNCVTAILDTLNDEFAGQPDGTRSPLGGVVEGEGSLAFIPFVSADQVNARYRLLGRYRVPSYRELRLREMREQGSPFWLGLRESNTLTSKSYQRGEHDSFFVFFTEDPVWLRPIFGAVNLVAAVGESVWGLVTLPIDRGRTLSSGLKGAFVSLPELVFANIRKGSNDWVAPEHRQIESQAVVRKGSPRTHVGDGRPSFRPNRKVGAYARIARRARSSR